MENPGGYRGLKISSICRTCGSIKLPPFIRGIVTTRVLPNLLLIYRLIMKFLEHTNKEPLSMNPEA